MEGFLNLIAGCFGDGDSQKHKPYPYSSYHGEDSSILGTTSMFGERMSGDSGMYPYQRTPMGNPYIRPITRGYLWVSYPQESQG